MKPGNKNSYKSLASINIDGKNYKYFSLVEAEKNGLNGISKLPKSIKVLLENLLRYEDDTTVNKDQIDAIRDWLKNKKSSTEIAYRPARVLLQDYTGIPAVADLAAMREAIKEKNKDPKSINPLSQVDLVIDHSVQVDEFAKKNSLNLELSSKKMLEQNLIKPSSSEYIRREEIVADLIGSGEPVNLETSIHLKPNFLISLYVPPELINCILYFFNIFKINKRFFLSDTEIKALLIFFIIF